MRILTSLVLLILVFVNQPLFSQNGYFESFTFTKADSLRGSLNPNRSCYDVLHYQLEVTIDPKNPIIKGSNTLTFLALTNHKHLQIDLQKPLHISQAVLLAEDEISCSTRQDGNVTLIELPYSLQTGKTYQLKLQYEGIPRKAVNPPWDGGFMNTTDQEKNHWLAVNCQGLGASSWWPCKDYLGDEPDSMDIILTVPKSLQAIANGQFVSEKIINNWRTAHWKVNYPINTYNVSFYIGNYSYFQLQYKNLPLHFYFLKTDLKRAQAHFNQVDTLLAVYEKYLGPYPFQLDGYKLVQAPYWGMEHQSAVAYGSNFKNNAFGFDFILVHESGHEWFGNHVSISDNADLWVHEAYTTYMEAVYLEELKGKDKAIAYLWTQRKKIQNKLPIQGPKGVNFTKFGGADMYYKGAWMLHTLRSVCKNDSLWFASLRKIQEQFGMTTTTAEEIVRFLSDELPIDADNFFEQYLYSPDIPKLQLKIDAKRAVITAQYFNSVEGFSMPIRIIDGQGNSFWIHPKSGISTEWELPKNMNLKKIKVDMDYFLVD